MKRFIGSTVALLAVAGCDGAQQNPSFENRIGRSIVVETADLRIGGYHSYLLRSDGSGYAATYKFDGEQEILLTKNAFQRGSVDYLEAVEPLRKITHLSGDDSEMSFFHDSSQPKFSERIIPCGNRVFDHPQLTIFWKPELRKDFEIGMDDSVDKLRGVSLFNSGCQSREAVEAQNAVYEIKAVITEAAEQAEGKR